MKRQISWPPLLLVGCVVVAVAAAAGTEALQLRDVNFARNEDRVGSLEAVEEAGYPRRRALYGDGSISYGTLTKSKAACYGPCPARGRPYTGRGCEAIYRCRS